MNSKIKVTCNVASHLKEDLGEEVEAVVKGLIVEEVVQDVRDSLVGLQF